MYNTELFVVPLVLFRVNSNGDNDDGDDDDRTERAQRKRVWNMSVRVFVQKWISAKTTTTITMVKIITIRFHSTRYTHLWLGYIYERVRARVCVTKEKKIESWTVFNVNDIKWIESLFIISVTHIVRTTNKNEDEKDERQMAVSSHWILKLAAEYSTERIGIKEKTVLIHGSLFGADKEF